MQGLMQCPGIRGSHNRRKEYQMTPNCMLRADNLTHDCSLQELVPETDSNLSFCSDISPLVP
jgi:hypothetical protein